MPTCAGASANTLYFLSGTSIYNFDPTLPISASNPTLNSITAPGPSIGLSLGKNLNAATPAITFYVSAFGTGGFDYWYYNGATWVNTGFNSGSSGACNPGSGGNYIFNLDDANGDIYRYDGTGNGTFLASSPGWDGPHDVQGDCAGNYYVLSCSTNKWLHESNSAGTLINSWTLTGMTTTSSGGGMAIINGHVYANNTSGFWDGTISAGNVAFTLVTSSGLSPGPIDFGTCPLGGLTGNTNIDTAFYCGVGPATLLTSPGIAPYSWTVLSGPAVITNIGTTGDSVSVTSNATSRIQVTSAPGSSACSSNIDTFLLVVPGVKASAHAGITDTIFGCGVYVDSLRANFSSNASWLNYHFNWTPSATISSGVTTLNPVIHPTSNTKYFLVVTTDTAQGNCLWSDSVKVLVVDKSVNPASTPNISFGCDGIDNVQFSNSDPASSYIRWTLGDGAGFVGRTVTHAYQNQKVYTAQCFVSNEWCKDSVNVPVNLDHPVHATFQPSKYTVCQGEQLNFINTSVDTTRNGIAPSYTWDFGNGVTSTSNSPSYTYDFTDTGSYRVMLVAQDFVPCYDTTYANINVLSKPKHYSMDSSFCEPNTTIPIGLVIDNADTYMWNTKDKQTTPSILPQASGLYTVTTSNQCGTTLDSVNVILYQCGQCLFVPNAFTPNGDGRNDYFHVRQTCPIRSYGIKIFSRYGQLVYSNYYISEGWDATLNGVPVDIGTYFYEIEYTPDLPNAHVLSLKGDVTVIR